jgi:hypothetical protein
MYWKGIPLPLVAFALAACQTVNATGEYRNVIKIEFASRITPEELAERIQNAAGKCWIGRESGLKGLKMIPLADYPDKRVGGLQLSFVDPKNRDRYANVIVAPTSNQGSGYILAVNQKGDGVDVTSALRSAISNLEWARPLC